MEQMDPLPFTSEAEETIRLAYREALRLRHQEVGTKHILLGLISMKQSAAGRVLYRLGLELGPTRRMEERLKQTAELNEQLKPEMNQAAKTTLEYAVEEAQAVNQSQVSTGHLLLALIRVEDGVALETLRHFDITPQLVQTYRDELLQGG